LFDSPCGLNVLIIALYYLILATSWNLMMGYTGLFSFAYTALAAIGGLGSIPGSLIGGILLGVGETLGSVYLNSAYKDVYGFALLMLFLIFRPRGLFGQAA